MFFHAQAVRQGNFRLAQFIMRLLHNRNAFVADYNNELYETGFANWLMNNCSWHNARGGFRVTIYG